MRSRRVRGASASFGVLLLAACTEQVVVRPEGEFSWEPPSRLAWPVQGAIVSPFGDPARPNHQGIDLAARPGEPVAAAMLGRVDFVGEIPGYGDVIVLSHADHLATVYADVGTPQVREGETVSRGQTIATVGTDGYLHYEIRTSKEAVDPAGYYEIAPQPLVGGSADMKRKVASEPASVGQLGALGVETSEPPPTALPTAQPIPRPTAEPTLRPTAEPTPRPTAEPTPRPTPEPTAQPTRAPTPRPTREPIRKPTSVPAPTRRIETPIEPAPAPTIAEPEATPPTESSQRSSSSFALAAELVGANLFYVPAKCVYAGVGAVTGAIALVLAHDTAVANDVWGPTLGGDYVVTAEHLRGEAPLRFRGGD